MSMSSPLHLYFAIFDMNIYFIGLCYVGFSMPVSAPNYTAPVQPTALPTAATPTAAHLTATCPTAARLTATPPTAACPTAVHLTATPPTAAHLTAANPTAAHPEPAPSALAGKDCSNDDTGDMCY